MGLPKAVKGREDELLDAVHVVWSEVTGLCGPLRLLVGGWHAARVWENLWSWIVCGTRGQVIRVSKDKDRDQQASSCGLSIVSQAVGTSRSALASN